MGRCLLQFTENRSAAHAAYAYYVRPGPKSEFNKRLDRSWSSKVVAVMVLLLPHSPPVVVVVASVGSSCCCRLRVRLRLRLRLPKLSRLFTLRRRLICHLVIDTSADERPPRGASGSGNGKRRGRRSWSWSWSWSGKTALRSQTLTVSARRA